MKAARMLLALLLSSCTHALAGTDTIGAAIDEAVHAATVAARDEGVLTAVCREGLRVAKSDAEAALIAGRCDAAYALYDELARDLDAVIAAIEEAKLTNDMEPLIPLVLRLEASRRAFEKAVRELGADA